MTTMRENSLTEVRVETLVAEAVQAAREFVAEHFPDCAAAVLFGSFAHGDPAENSDLDLLIIERGRIRRYQRHFRERDWFIDVTALSLRLCTKRLLRKNSCWHHRDPDFPLLIACARGTELKDDRGIIRELRHAAKLVLENGPVPLTAQEISNYRWLITEGLEDFVDAEDRAEAWFTAFQTVIETSRFLLGYNRQWTLEDPRWVYRNIRNYDHVLARELLDGLERYSRSDDRAQLARPVESILNLAGGKLYRDSDTAYPTTAIQQVLQHPFYLTKKAVTLARRALS